MSDDKPSAENVVRLDKPAEQPAIRQSSLSKHLAAVRKSKLAGKKKPKA